MNPTLELAQQDPNHLASAFAAALAQYIGPENIKKATGTPQGPYLHGPGGLFGVRGLTRGVISTHTNITGSLAEVIPVGPTGAMVDPQMNQINPLFPFITGFVRSDTQDKNAICDDPEEAGQMKTCIGTAVFGRKEFKTRTLEINHVGSIINRGEFDDLQLANSPLVNQMGGLMQNFMNLSNAAAVLAGREMLARFIEVGVSYQRWFCPQVYTGNPANSSAGGGYKEFAGLDLLISTTKVDALNGVACPSLRSLIMSFGFRQVSSTTDPDIYRTLSSMMYYLETKAVQQNMAPVQFALVMRSQLFFELTRYWPLAYNTDGTGTTLGAFDSIYKENIAMRDAMRNGMYLTINSKNYPVILDDCIIEDTKATQASLPATGYASDIYIVPLTVRGGTMRTLYWEYYDYSNGQKGTMQAVQDARASTFFWTDNGVFLWGIRPPNNWCVDAISKVEPRLILRTPQLAARLTDVAYVPLIHTDDPLPSQPYHLNGGIVTGRPGPSPYSEWNLGGPGMGNN